MVGNTMTVIGTPAKGVGLKTISAAGVAESVYNDIIVLPWNDPELLERTIKREGDRIAGVITEGYQSNWGVIPPEKGYLELMRRLTKQNDIVFIMDEVITGFRLGYGGAQEYTGVVPDISPLSKALANGVPIAAVVGKKKFMEAMSSESTYFAGTFNGNPLSTAAGLATITELESHGSYSKILQRGMGVMSAIRDALSDNHISGVVQGPGTMWSVYFTDLESVTKTREIYSFPVLPHVRRSALFYQGIVKRGIFINPTRYGRMYFSWAHTEEDVKRTVEACRDSIRDLKRAD
jgi:glutamate-1-semialdehyde 2,1-aminomutase